MATDPQTDAAVEPVRSSDGRVPGRRGRETRDSLLASTAELLATTSYRDLKVVDIARHAGTSPATFYQYFSDVEEAILLLTRRVVDEADVLCDAVAEGDWSSDGRREAALGLADAFLEFWDEHEAILRVVELAIVEGDRRFRTERNRLLGPVTERLAEQIDGVHAESSNGSGDGDASTADAAVLVSMLVHVAEHHPRIRDWGVDVDALRTSMSRLVAAGVSP